MCLLVVQGLDTIFQQSQKCVVVADFVDNFSAQQAQLADFTQGAIQRRRLQAGIASATQNLETLGQEFNFADTARPALDIVQPVFAPGIVPDVGMHFLQSLDRAVIDISTVDKWPDILDKPGAGLEVTSYRPGLDQRIPLPVPPLPLVILLQGGQAGGQWARISKRPKPSINTEAKAVTGDFREAGDDSPRQAGKELVIGHASTAIADSCLRVAENDVYIRREIEFTAAELAQANNEHALRTAIFAPRGTVLFHQRTVMFLERELQADLSQRCQVAKGFSQGRKTGKVPPDNV